jgi:hypothetical protein
MQISYGPIELGRHQIRQEIIKAKTATTAECRVIDLGAVAGQGWASDLTDLVIDINANPLDSRALALDICDPETWDQLFDLVEKQGLFDYAICTHTLEDLYDPIMALRYLPKIAKAGAISMPSLQTELCREDDPRFLGYIHHRWLFDQEDGQMLLAPKLTCLESIMNPPTKYNPQHQEILYRWQGSIPYKMFMNNYLGPDTNTVMNTFRQFIKDRVTF